MSFLIDVLNGVQKLVSATPAAVGAEPAFGDPGPGTWYLRSIGAIRSWVAQVPWAGVDKTGAVATDVGALPTANPTATGTLTAPDVIGGLARMQASAVSPSNQAWFGYTGLNSAGAYVGYYPGSDGAVRIAAASGKAVSIGTGAAYGQLAISDSGVASSSLAGTGTRSVSADATGKLVANATEALPVANPTATGTLTAPDVVVSNLAGGVRFVVTDAAGKLVATYAPPSLPYLPTSGGIVSGDVAIDGLLRSQHSYPIPSGAFTLTDSFPNNSAFTVSGAATCDLDGTLSPGIEFTIATLASAITLQFSTVTCYLNGALVPTGTVLPQGRMYKMQLFNGTVWFING